LRAYIYFGKEWIFENFGYEPHKLQAGYVGGDMESIFSMILSEENIRTLVTLVAIACGIIWLNGQFDKKMDKKFNEYDEKMDKKLDDFHVKLKTNDFAHLNNAICELTFLLEKNGFLKTSDREHINSKLDM
jgi:hypothetical protein